MLEFLKAYGIVIPIFVFMISLLGMDAFSFNHCFIQTIFMLCVMYFGHVIAHFPVFEKINPHVFLHHNHSLNIPRWLELSIESLYPFTTALSIHYISKSILSDVVFSTSILIGTAILYNVVHILDYSNLGSLTHQQHHIYHRCNYEPIFMDAIFRTRCDNSSPYVNTNHQVIHAVMATSFVLILKLIFNLT